MEYKSFLGMKNYDLPLAVVGSIFLGTLMLSSDALAQRKDAKPIEYCISGDSAKIFKDSLQTFRGRVTTTLATYYSKKDGYYCVQKAYLTTESANNRTMFYKLIFDNDNKTDIETLNTKMVEIKGYSTNDSLFVDSVRTLQK